MRRAFWHSRDFQRYFFTYAILFFCMLLAGAVVVVLATQAERQQAADQQRTAQGKRIAEVVDNAWDSAIEAGNFLRSSTWVQKYMSETDVFAQEFGPLRQREFSQSLTALCASTDLIRGISIWYPQKDIVVSSAGWFSSEEYEASLRIMFCRGKRRSGRCSPTNLHSPIPVIWFIYSKWTFWPLRVL